MEWWHLFAALTALSLLLSTWQWLEGRLFPLHRRLKSREAMPPLSLLKPLKGAEPALLACLRSWFVQNYPGPFEILFGVESEADPACAIARRVMEEHPEIPARLIVCGPPEVPNGKVAKLARLAREARHPWWVLSDADVKVPPDLLANLVPALHQPETGLVHCFYRLGEAHTPAMHCEAVAVNADFWTSVLQARRLGLVRFALGAVMALRRDTVETIGGFESLGSNLADDFELGRRIAAAGKRIHFCRVAVDCLHPRQGWGAVWRHQLRWARTIRACRPGAYAASLLAHPWLAAACMVASAPNLLSWQVLGICLGVRLLTAFDNQRRLTQSAHHLPWLWLVPIKDLLQLAWWTSAFLGNTVEWGGRKYRVRMGGRLEPLGPLPPRATR